MKRKTSLFILLIFFGIITIFGIYKLILIVKEYKSGYDTYNNLKQYVNTNSNETIINEEDDNFKDNIHIPQIDFTSLKEINKDIVGWINIDNLNIDYPIVQGINNDYYLNHMVDGTYNTAGSIFMDYRNNSNLNDRHTIIYGHNMKNGSMFSKLTKYKEQKYFEENSFYLLMTPNNNYKVEIIASYVANVNDSTWQIIFPSNQDFNNWLNYTINKSLIISNITPTINDKIITLSTCSNESNDTRFVLVGILKELPQ